MGFNGKEKNLEINSGSYTTEYRQLDTRIGRWLSIEPKANIQPEQSPYNFANIGLGDVETYDGYEFKVDVKEVMGNIYSNASDATKYHVYGIL